MRLLSHHSAVFYAGRKEQVLLGCEMFYLEGDCDEVNWEYFLKLPLPKRVDRVKIVLGSEYHKRCTATPQYLQSESAGSRYNISILLLNRHFQGAEKNTIPTLPASGRRPLAE